MQGVQTFWQEGRIISLTSCRGPKKVYFSNSSGHPCSEAMMWGGGPRGRVLTHFWGIELSSPPGYTIICYHRYHFTTAVKIGGLVLKLEHLFGGSTLEGHKRLSY